MHQKSGKNNQNKERNVNQKVQGGNGLLYWSIGV